LLQIAHDVVRLYQSRNISSLGDFLNAFATFSQPYTKAIPKTQNAVFEVLFGAEATWYPRTVFTDKCPKTLVCDSLNCLGVVPGNVNNTAAWHELIGMSKKLMIDLIDYDLCLGTLTLLQVDRFAYSSMVDCVNDIYFCQAISYDIPAWERTIKGLKAAITYLQSY